MADLAQIENAARAAYIFGLPYIEMARTRAAFLRDGRPTGRFVHTRRLTTVADRWVTTPNNDTLYSSAWLDLGQGPVALDTPEFGARDWSVALLAMTTTNFAIPGTRSHGNRPGRFLIVGPGWEGDAGDRVVLRAPTRWVWALARIVVDGAADEAAVHGVQDGLVLTPTAARWAHAGRSMAGQFHRPRSACSAPITGCAYRSHWAGSRHCRWRRRCICQPEGRF